MERTSYQIAKRCALGATCLALNVGLGKVSNLLSLPITFDVVGTILAAALLPPWVALLVAAMSSVLGSLIIHPAFIYYIGTQIAVCLTALGALRLGFFNRPWKAIIAGAGIGIVSAIVSAPVTAIVFQGVSVPSLTALNVLFMASGNSLLKSVISGSLIIESTDKAVAGVIVWLILKRLPKGVATTHISK